MRYSKVLICLIFFTIQLFSQQQGYRKSWALIVGINEYQSLPRLSGAVKSAKMVREKLVREFGFDPENVIELYDDQATRENILKAFDKLMDPKRVSKDDRALVYFAGHGVTKNVGGKDKGYIMPVDGVMDKFVSTAISTDQLHEFQEIIPAKHLLYVMDACYSGTIFTRGIGLKSETFTSKLEAILKFTGKKARVAITAGSKDEQVVDLADQGISVFSFYFLRGLDGEADVDNDGIITVSELADYVARNVRFRAPQNPQYGKLPGDEDGEFVFVKVSPQDEIEQRAPQPQVVKPTPTEAKPKDLGRKVERKTIIQQPELKKLWVYGFIGGNANFHSLSGEIANQMEETSGGGANLGLGIQYLIDMRFAFGVNLLVEQKNGNWKIKPFEYLEDDYVVKLGPDVTYDITLGYVVINPVVKFYYGGFYVNAGPAIGFPTDKKYKFKAGYRAYDVYGNFIESGTLEKENKIEDVKTRFSVPVGAGYDFNISMFKIFIEARYDIGVNKVTKEDDWKISSFQLLLGARFGF